MSTNHKTSGFLYRSFQPSLACISVCFHHRYAFELCTQACNNSVWKALRFIADSAATVRQNGHLLEPCDSRRTASLMMFFVAFQLCSVWFRNYPDAICKLGAPDMRFPHSATLSFWLYVGGTTPRRVFGVDARRASGQLWSGVGGFCTHPLVRSVRRYARHVIFASLRVDYSPTSYPITASCLYKSNTS